MNIPEYIGSGVLEDYCLGALTEAEKAEVEKMCAKYPEIQEHLVLTQQGLEAYVTEKPVWRKAALSESIWNTLNNLNTEEEAKPGKFPYVNKYSDYKNWLKMVKPLLPTDLKEGTFTEVIQHDEKITQLLVMSYLGQPEEEHDNMQESFFILEGECECNIGGEIIPLKAGGYIDIPLYTTHSISLTTPKVIAIIQRIAIAS